MVIYFYLLIPLLFLSTDSSSIRDRNNKNEPVPFLSSRLDPLKRDSNSLKIVSNEPFIIQLQMPKSMEKESKRAHEKDKKKKRPAKKSFSDAATRMPEAPEMLCQKGVNITSASERAINLFCGRRRFNKVLKKIRKLLNWISKIKPLRKKHRTRRDLIVSKRKIRDEKSNQSDIAGAANETGHTLKNFTKNSIIREEILKALSSYPKKVNKHEDVKRVEKMKHNINVPSRNLHKNDFALSDQTPRVEMIYPSTPKSNRHPHKYTHKDLMADRERLEQKIKYIKNMFNVNDSTSDDAVRVRRRSDSDKTANKIAKMFLTLSAVNGLHDRRKSKCEDDEDDEDRVQDFWGKEKRNDPARRTSSSNEERYKVKKWIEFMKNKRSSGKTCPCLTNAYGQESDIFPLEQKLPKGYFLRGRSSEESSESYNDPFYYSRDKLNYNNNSNNDDDDDDNKTKNRFQKTQDREHKIKALAKNGKKKLEFPFDDLEIYRSRAKQILQNAEEILDRIKEEEEKRLQAPNILMSQLKELTSRIQTDPRNNENDLIRKVQKNLGWGPLAKPNEGTDDNTFIDNVKSFILDPYEKAKALTDESTKKLSSYLLRNLGKLPESFEEQEEGIHRAVDVNPEIYFEQISQKEEKPVSASLAKEDPTANVFFKQEEEEDLKSNGDTLSITFAGIDAVNSQEEPFKQRMKDMIKEQEKKLSDYKVTLDSEENKREVNNFDQGEEKVAKTATEAIHPGKEITEEAQSESREVNVKLKELKENENENVTLKAISNSDIVGKKKKSETVETAPQKEDQTDITTSENMQLEKEYEKEVEEILKNDYENDKNVSLDLIANNEEIKNIDEREKERNIIRDGNTESDNIVSQELEQKLGRRRENEKHQNEEEPEKVAASSKTQEIVSEDLKTTNQKEKEENVPPSNHSINNYEDEGSEKPFEINGNLKQTPKAFEESSDEANSNNETILEQSEIEINEANPTKTDFDESSFAQDNSTNFPNTPRNSKENVGSEGLYKEASEQSQDESLELKEKQNTPDDETSQEESSAEKLQHVGPAKELTDESKELSESNYLINTESGLKSDEQSNEKQEGESQKNEDQSLTVEIQTGEDLIGEEKVKERTAEEVLENENDSKKREKNSENDSRTDPDEQNPEELNGDDADILLKVTLEKNSNENEKAVPKSEESFDRASEDDQLQAAKSESQENETVEKGDDNINDETSLKKGFENENDGIALKGEKPTEEVSDELLGQKRNDDGNTEIPLKEENTGEEKGDQTLLKIAMYKQSDEKELNDENVVKTSSKNATSKEESDEGVNEKVAESNGEGSSETFLKSSWKKDKDLEGHDSDETSLKLTNVNLNTNESDDAETENTIEEVSDNVLPEDIKKNDQSVEQSTLKLERLTDHSKNKEENQKAESLEKDDSDETTLRVATNEKDSGNSNETGEETLPVADFQDKEEKRLNKNDEKEATSILEKPQIENSAENQSQESILGSQEQDNLKKDESESILKEKRLETQINQSNENLEEKNGENDENSEEINDEENPLRAANFDISMPKEEVGQDRKSKEESNYDALKEVSNEETEKDIHEASDDETLKAVKLNKESEGSREKVDSGETYSRSTLRDKDQKKTKEMDDDDILKEPDYKESEQGQDNLKTDGGNGSNETSEETIPDNQGRATVMRDDDTEGKLKENKRNEEEVNLEKAGDDYTTLRSENLEEDQNNQVDNDNRNSFENDRDEISLKSALESQDRDQETIEEVETDESLRAENHEEDQEKEETNNSSDKTFLRTASSEDESDNKIDETPLKSTKAAEEKDSKESLKNRNNDEGEETLRQVFSDVISNEIDQENEDESPLRSEHFDKVNDKESEKSLYEESHENLRAGSLSAENLSEENDYEPPLKALESEQEQNHLSKSDLIQNPDSASKYSKTGKLKIPKSIGKIMKDLESREREDVISLQNLNPDKIDHIIDKIDEAEKQNLQQSREVDCKKECACAEEIDTKSRNMGRYEIAKDFLYWMKDLQLNRVLSDD